MASVVGGVSLQACSSSSRAITGDAAHFSLRRKQPAASPSSSSSLLSSALPCSTSPANRSLSRTRRRLHQQSSKAVAVTAILGGAFQAQKKAPALTFIDSEAAFDEALQKAGSEPLIIDWMASWCRKCIYLKPKLEKLAASDFPNIAFYAVDVNAVPMSLCKDRAGIRKMPTIQVWKDGELKEEVIGGDQPWLVLDKVRDMVKKYI